MAYLAQLHQTHANNTKDYHHHVHIPHHPSSISSTTFSSFDSYRLALSSIGTSISSMLSGTGTASFDNSNTHQDYTKYSNNINYTNNSHQKQLLFEHYQHQQEFVTSPAFHDAAHVRS